MAQGSRESRLLSSLGQLRPSLVARYLFGVVMVDQHLVAHFCHMPFAAVRCGACEVVGPLNIVPMYTLVEEHKVLGPPLWLAIAKTRIRQELHA